jgi:hypothetical protein
VYRDADALPGLQPAGIALAPIGARGAVVKKMGVDIDKHPSLPLFLLLRRLLGQAAESRFSFIADGQIEIGLRRFLLLQCAILVVDIIEPIDGLFSR